MKPSVVLLSGNILVIYIPSDGYVFVHQLSSTLTNSNYYYGRIPSNTINCNVSLELCKYPNGELTVDIFVNLEHGWPESVYRDVLVEQL